MEHAIPGVHAVPRVGTGGKDLMLDGWLLALSDEDLSMAIDAIYDSEVAAELTIARPDLMVIGRPA